MEAYGLPSNQSGSALAFVTFIAILPNPQTNLPPIPRCKLRPKGARRFGNRQVWYASWVQKIVAQIELTQTWAKRAGKDALFPRREDLPAWMREMLGLRARSGWEAWWEVAKAAILYAYPDGGISTLSAFEHIRQSKSRDHNPKKVLKSNADFQARIFDRLRRQFKRMLRSARTSQRVS